MDEIHMVVLLNVESLSTKLASYLCLPQLITAIEIKVSYSMSKEIKETPTSPFEPAEMTIGGYFISRLEHSKITMKQNIRILMFLDKHLENGLDQALIKEIEEN